jgi:hypothetical protein
MGRTFASRRAAEDHPRATGKKRGRFRGKSKLFRARAPRLTEALGEDQANAGRPAPEFAEGDRTDGVDLLRASLLLCATGSSPSEAYGLAL